MKGSKGYTILEVLIFIAVSALIFVGAIGLVAGRQQQVQFNESVRDFESKIRDIINDVSTGYYPASALIECRDAGGNVSLIEDTANNFAIGTNDECIYTGKILTFTNNADQNMQITNLVGLRSNGTSLVASLDESRSTPANFDSVIENYLMSFGLQVTQIINSDGTGNYGAIAITTSFSDSIVNAKQVNIAGVTGTSMSGTNSIADLPNLLTDDDNNPTALGYVNTKPGTDLIVCLEGGNGKSASLTIGRTTTSDVVLIIGDREDGFC